MVDSKFEFITEGVEKTSFYEGRRGRFNTWFGLEGFSPGFLLATSLIGRKEGGKGEGRGGGGDQYLTTGEAHSNNTELVL